jgi:hypothetical protein
MNLLLSEWSQRFEWKGACHTASGGWTLQQEGGTSMVCAAWTLFTFCPQPIHLNLLVLSAPMGQQQWGVPHLVGIFFLPSKRSAYAGSDTGSQTLTKSELHVLHVVFEQALSLSTEADQVVMLVIFATTPGLIHFLKPTAQKLQNQAEQRRNVQMCENLCLMLCRVGTRGLLEVSPVSVADTVISGKTRLRKTGSGRYLATG